MDKSCFLSPSHAVRVTAPSSEGAFKAVRQTIIYLYKCTGLPIIGSPVMRH